MLGVPPGWQADGSSFAFAIAGDAAVLAWSSIERVVSVEANAFVLRVRVGGMRGRGFVGARVQIFSTMSSALLGEADLTPNEALASDALCDGTPGCIRAGSDWRQQLEVQAESHLYHP